MTNQCNGCDEALTSNRSIWSPSLCNECVERAIVWAAKRYEAKKAEV
jgi:hypothetical protein